LKIVNARFTQEPIATQVGGENPTATDDANTDH